jgi:hypothetical protein
MKFLEFQQFATQLVSHPNLLDVAAQLENDDQVFKANEADPMPFFVKNGINLPEGATVSISRNSPLTLIGCIDAGCITISINIDISITT